MLLPLLLFGSLFVGGIGSSDHDPGDPPPPPETGDVKSVTSVGEELSGTSLGDLLLGLGGPDTIEGLGGDDVVAGEFGYDKLTGDAGNDLVLGGAGNALMFGSSGADSMQGGDGNDTMVGLEYDEIAADLIVTAQTLQEDIQAAFGTVVTQGQLDRVSTAVTSGSAGERGADVLQCGLGNDRLIGDEGDTMSGGEGTDGFGVNYNPSDAATTITDFDNLTERLVLVLDNPDTATITIQANGADSAQIFVDGRIAVRLTGQIAADLIANQDNWLRLEQV